MAKTLIIDASNIIIDGIYELEDGPHSIVVTSTPDGLHAYVSDLLDEDEEKEPLYVIDISGDRLTLDKP